MTQPPGHRKSRRRQLQASHQKNWLTGRYAVQEALRAATWPVASVLVADDLVESDWSEVQQLADIHGVRLELAARDRLTELCGSAHHQGFLAKMNAYPYETVDTLLQRTIGADPTTSDTRFPVLVICDRIQDSFNFGAILRCCDAMNVSGVVIGESAQVGVTPQVARSSAGAVNHVPIAVASELTQAVSVIADAGFCIAAASEKSASSAWSADLKKPVGLIIGSEAAGVSDSLLQQCTLHLRIPMMGKVSSLNAAVATGILLYEIRRQQLIDTDSQS